MQNFPPAAGYRCPKDYKIAKILLCSPPQADNFGGLTVSQKSPLIIFRHLETRGEFLRGIHVMYKSRVKQILPTPRVFGDTAPQTASVTYIYI